MNLELASSDAFGFLAISVGKAFSTQHLPLLAVPVVVILFLWKRAGSATIQFVQRVDSFFVAIFRKIAWLTGAMWLPSSNWKRVVRYLWFLTFFGACLGTGLYYNSSDVSESFSFLAAAAIALGYVTALSIGRTWVSVESRLLDREDGADGWGISAGLRPLAVASLILLLLFIPLSFDTAENKFSQFDLNSASSVEASVETAENSGPDYDLWDWGLVTLDFTLLAAIDAFEVFGSEHKKTERLAGARPGGQALVLTNFLTLAYVFVTGITLLARGDHAMRVDFDRLKERGELGQITRHGVRGMDKLVEMLKSGSLSESAQVAAVLGLGEIREKSGIGHTKAFQLVKDTLLSRDASLNVRYESAVALGKWRNPKGLDALFTALEYDRRTSVRAAAAMSIRKIGHLDNDQIRKMIQLGRCSMTPDQPSADISIRQTIAHTFFVLPYLMDNDGVRAMLSEWMQQEGDDYVKDKLGAALDLHSKERRRATIEANLTGLQAPEPETRRASADALAPFISEGKVARALMKRIPQEEVLDPRLRMVKALYKERTGKAGLNTQIQVCLRNRLREDSSAQVRTAAASGLRTFSPASQATLKLLVSTLEKDSNATVRKTCARALSKLGGSAELLAYARRRTAEARKQSPNREGEAVNQEVVDFVTGILRDLVEGDDRPDSVEEG